MKKLLLVLALSFAAALCASAQNLSVLGKAARLAYDYLSKEGYKPYIDEDDDVVFKAEGYSFYVDNTKSDETYLQIVMPNMMEVDADDTAQLLAVLGACNQITQSKKLVQAFVSDDGDLTFVTDTYIGSGDMDEFIDSSITFMIRSVSAFSELYREYLGD